MQNLHIRTRLMGREETFRLLALSQATRLPAVLIGPKGVGKTQALLDYAAAFYNGNREQAIAESFILEFDEGTRTSEVKGHPDMNALLTQHKFVRDSPITSAKYVMLNEIDKASAGCRTSLYGIMNERMLFDGGHKTPCQWEVLVGAVNQIPQDEADNPMWDRFVLKQELTRLSPEQMLNYFQEQHAVRTSEEAGADLEQFHELVLHLPSQEEMDAVVFKPEALSAFINVCHKHLSDRTLTYVQRLASAAVYVYGVPPTRALVQVCALLTSTAIAKELSKKIEPQQVTDIRSKIEMMATSGNEEGQLTAQRAVVALIKKAIDDKVVDQQEGAGLLGEMKEALQASPVWKKRQAREQELAAKLGSAKAQGVSGMAVAA